MPVWTFTVFDWTFVPETLDYLAWIRVIWGWLGMYYAMLSFLHEQQIPWHFS